MSDFPQVSPSCVERGTDFGKVEIEEDGLVAELLSRLAEPALAFGVGEDLALLRDENTAARAAFEDAIPDQVLIGASDGIGVDDQRFGEDADGRELLADLQATEGHGLPHLLNDLAKNRDVAAWGNGNSERHECIN